MSKPIRCAIYTRKSTEDGLEQEFNSLDAQREACEAYIVSQRHEGWTLVPDRYDDGGYSGGNMGRPGLVELLEAVREGQVNVIVVYKVDRLTRSLADFAKIVETLDGAGASFVSITQAFNTTTSMGRLTLNVLLSFAQFEREVTGERIRDKIAASKKKGMWMGGNPSLGYIVNDRQLIIDEAEAATVRTIYQRYLDVRSIRRLVEELRDRKIFTKRIGPRGGIPFGRGSLHHLLRNSLYIAEIHYQGGIYPAQHAPIIDRTLWERVQRALSDAAVARKSGANVIEPSLLSGLLWDPAGRKMTPSHASKKGQRYRYYVTLEDHYESTESPFRFAAYAIERIVIDRLAQWLDDPVAQSRAASEASEVQTTIADTAAYADALRTGSGSARRSIILRYIERIALAHDSLTIQVRESADDGQSHALSASLGRVRRGNDVRIIVKANDARPSKVRNEELVQMLVDARAAQNLALSRPNHSLPSLARIAGRSERRFKRMLRFSYLSPEIVEAVLTGTQPSSLTCRGAHRVTGIPVRWDEQRRFFGLD